MTHKEKILKFSETTGLNKTNFCKKCGLSNGYLDSKGSITSDKLSKILENFRELNVNWLLFDKGEMRINTEKSIGLVSEPAAVYQKEDNYKDKYITILEENRALQTKVINLMEINSRIKKDDVPCVSKTKLK